MAVTFDEASQLWGLQRNRATGDVELVANAFGWKMDEITTRIDRNGPGLGIALEELGSDGEGAGLVVVRSCVDGGNAAAASEPILSGDVLVAVGTVGSRQSSVEAKPYDVTVEALGSLDPERPVLLTLRRLVKLPECKVTLKFNEEGRADEELTLLPGMPLRRSILSQGIKLNDPLARRFDAGWGTGDCGGEGTCATCAMKVLSGAEALNEQATQERQMLKKHPTWRLACKASIADLASDTSLVLEVAPRQKEDLF